MMRGTGTAHSAATIVNAMATGYGAAFGIDLKTEANVTVSSGRGVCIKTDVDESPKLVTLCIERFLDKFAPGEDYHVNAELTSNIPVSRGLKSSSAACNAVLDAMKNALSVECDVLELIKIGTAASIDCGVSLTGAFDDACASMLGGVVLTNNASNELMKRRPLEEDVAVVIDIPEYQIRKPSLDRTRIKAVAPVAKIAFEKADEGKYWEALTLNGMCYSAAFNLDQEISIRGLCNGALASGLTGSGPATIMVVNKDKLDKFIENMGEHRLIVANVNNGDFNETSSQTI